jgi:hypothetical protein
MRICVRVRVCVCTFLFVVPVVLRDTGETTCARTFVCMHCCGSGNLACSSLCSSS